MRIFAIGAASAPVAGAAFSAKPNQSAAVAARENHWYVGTESGALIDIDRDFISRHGEPWPRGEDGMLRSDKLTEAQWLGALRGSNNRAGCWYRAFMELAIALPAEHERLADHCERIGFGHSHYPRRGAFR